MSVHRLHALIDALELTDAEAASLAARLETWRDPVTRVLETAPEDDEPMTPEEEMAEAEAWAEHLRHPERAEVLTPRAASRR